MPTYRYQCAGCDRIHEIFQSMSEKPKKKCPECGGKLTRLIGKGGGVLLKGSGFYTTDYRSDSYQKAAKKESDSSSSKSSKSEGKKSKSSDSKKKKD